MQLNKLLPAAALRLGVFSIGLIYGLIYGLVCGLICGSPILNADEITKTTEIHVSPSGANANAGTANAPIQTLEKARDLAREARKANPDGSITIWLHPGIYMVRKTVDFSKADSGTPTGLLTIQNWPDPANPAARPHLVGGVVVNGWEKSTFNGRNDVYAASLAPYNITQKFKQIYLNGQRQVWARYPNLNPNLPYSGGWAYVDGERPPMYQDIEGERTDTVVLREKDLRNWSTPDDGEVCIFPRYNWWNRIVPIKSFDPQTRTITLTSTMQYAARPEDRFAVFGMKEELDAAGEWFQDVKNQKLYFLPPRDLAGQTVTVPTVNTILKFDGCENVLLRGLEFSCAENQSVYMGNCRNVVLEKSLVHDLGYMSGAGVSIHGGARCAVRGCDLWNLGGHGVEIYAGDAKSITKCEHVVDNCYVHHVGQFNRHGLGLMVGSTGAILSHNLIHDTPRCGIFHGGTFNVLEYNRIRHCNLEMEDTGCTYTGGWTGGWHTIRYNHCTDSIGFNNHGKFFVFAWGIYLDESGCGNDVYGNIVERCQVGAMHLHNARANHIFNNIFANNAGPDGKTHQFSMQTWNNSPNSVFRRDRQPSMIKNYNKLMENPEWAKQRGMNVSPENPYLPDGTIMHDNQVNHNIFYYPEQPNSRYVSENGINLESNKIDYNVVWNGGTVPVITKKQAYRAPQADVTSAVENVDFSTPATDEQLKKDPNQTCADGWFWYHKTFPDMQAKIIERADGTHALQLPGLFNPEKQYIKYTCIRSKPFKLEPGKTYRLTFKMRNQDATGNLSARFVAEGNGLWKPFGAMGFLKRPDMSDVCTTLEPYECQTGFRLPGPGEPDYDSRVDKLTLQFEFNSKQGWAEISDLKIEEVEKASEWEAWQMAGADVHSVVADPLFVDGAHGDFRLKADSPALKLGFKPIPLDKIGPYESDSRATWPIQEVEGAREHPEWFQNVDPQEN